MATKKKKKTKVTKKRVARKTPRKKTPKKKSGRILSRKKAKKKGLKKRAGFPGGVGGISANVEKVGEVSHYFPQVRAAAIKITKNKISVGDTLYIKGHTTDFKQQVVSMQLDRVPVREGKKGQEIGLLVKSRTRIGDSVYKI